MIFTVFVAPPNPEGDWRAQLLEYSWRRLRQPGELIRLAPLRKSETAPTHRRARVVATRSWNPHPYTEDNYAGYETPAALLEWLFTERIEGTILLLDLRSVLQKAIDEEARPGLARACVWPDPPSGEGPFGLNDDLRFLESYCVNRQLPIAPVRPPLLIHSSDLRKIAARWLELTSIIRHGYRDMYGKCQDADRVAYAIAAAEYRVGHETTELDLGTDAASGDAPILGYSTPVESSRGEIVWDEQVYEPWGEAFPENARPGAGRDFLALLNELATRVQAGTELDVTRPLRRPGVREARVLDDMHLEVPGTSEPVLLNPSAAAIWELCDGTRTLGQIVRELQERFDATAETLSSAVEATTQELEHAGALELEDLLT